MSSIGPSPWERPEDERRPRRQDPAAHRPDPDDQLGAQARASGGAHDAEEDGARPHVPFTQQLGRIALGVLALVFVVFAVANRHVVDFYWLFGATEVREVGGERVGGGVPLIVLLLASLAVGVVLGALVEWQVLRRAARPDRAERRGRGRR